MRKFLKPFVKLIRKCQITHFTHFRGVAQQGMNWCWICWGSGEYSLLKKYSTLNDHFTFFY